MEDNRNPLDRSPAVQQVSDHSLAAHPEQDEQTTRRTVLRWVIRASYGAFGLAFVLPALTLRTLTQRVQGVAAGDTLVYATGDQAGSPLLATAIKSGMAVQAFPKDKTSDSNNLVEVVRISDDAAGVVAFSAICTHLGCSVLGTLTGEGLIICPCHGSEYDPANQAAVRRGPAGRALPGLPINIEADGSIRATGGFTGKVGPD